MKVTGSPYTIKVKQCKTEMLLQTTNRKWYMAYRIASFPMTLNDLQVTDLLLAFSHRPTRCRIQLCSRWHDFNWHRASRGPSATAELLVNCNLSKHITGWRYASAVCATIWCPSICPSQFTKRWSVRKAARTITRSSPRDSSFLTPRIRV